MAVELDALDLDCLALGRRIRRLADREIGGRLPIAHADFEVVSLERAKASLADKKGSIGPVELEIDGSVG